MIEISAIRTGTMRVAGVMLSILLAACGTTSPDGNGRPGRQTGQGGAPAVGNASAEIRPPPKEALNPDVRQDTIHQTICVPGYSASVRPSTGYTNGVKRKLMREAGFQDSATDLFELDHRIALAVGGHPRSLVNLTLQQWEGQDGAKQKDRLERRLQVLVCSGKIELVEAQSALYWDWKGASKRYLLAR